MKKSDTNNRMTARGPRWEARQRGVMTYRPLKPCKRCGTSERRTDNGNCCECDRNVQRPRSKARYHADPERAIARSTQYRKDHLAEVQARLRQWVKQRVKTDRQFYLQRLIRKTTNQALRNVGRRRLIIGCTGAQFRQWLETKFTAEMTWDNYPEIWTVDHIKPLSAFDLTDPQQYSAACHYTNTRPMLRAANIKKGPPPRTPHDSTTGRFMAKDH